MSDKKFYLKFVDAHVQGIISLCWDNAPKTCQALWGALQTPIRWQATHAMFSGPEIMMGLPESHRNFDPTALPPEDQTIIPEVGELLWYYQPKNFFKIDPTEFWEIGMFYGVGGRTFTPVERHHDIASSAAPAGLEHIGTGGLANGRRKAEL